MLKIWLFASYFILCSWQMPIYSGLIMENLQNDFTIKFPCVMIMIFIVIFRQISVRSHHSSEHFNIDCDIVARETGPFEQQFTKKVSHFITICSYSYVMRLFVSLLLLSIISCDEPTLFQYFKVYFVLQTYNRCAPQTVNSWWSSIVETVFV